MPGQINRLPEGVAGFLGIKNSGKMPDYLADVLSGVWDLSQWYLNTDVSWQISSLTAVATGQNLVFTVPQNQIWYVTNLGIFHNAAAASGNAVSMCRFGQRTTDFCPIGTQERVAASQSNNRGIDTPFIVSAGETLGYSCTELTGTGLVQMYVRYRSMQV